MISLEGLGLLMFALGALALGGLLVRHLARLGDKPGICRTCGERTGDLGSECQQCWDSRQW